MFIWVRLDYVCFTALVDNKVITARVHFNLVMHWTVQNNNNINNRAASNAHFVKLNRI